ncbi:MAG: DNA gyrase inhibitor YacG [Acidobacteria bacterium]|nr:DNA gyrase inhibitor YacG [Acidobacteriota bacterium]
MPEQKILRCPTCRTIVPMDSPDVPFCSDRCRLIDLGKWASGDYKISSPILDPDVLEGLAENMPRKQDEDDE